MLDDTCPGGLKGCQCCARVEDVCEAVRVHERDRLIRMVEILVKQGMFTPDKFSELARTMIETGPVEVDYRDGSIHVTQNVRIHRPIDRVEVKIEERPTCRACGGPATKREVTGTVEGNPYAERSWIIECDGPCRG